MSGILIDDLGVKYDDKVIFDGFNLALKENKISVILGGSGVGNPRFVRAEQIEWQKRGWSVPVTLPPLGAIYLRYRPDLENGV